jgi:abortive infection bacteriophage resistance protein
MNSFEVAAPGAVSLESLPRRSLIVREARMGKEGLAFVGSYRYDGYSLFDILKEKAVAKKNTAEFRSVIDLLVVYTPASAARATPPRGAAEEP